MARLTQEFSEVVIEQNSNSNLSQMVGEVTITQSDSARISSTLAEVPLNMSASARLSHIFIEVAIIPFSSTEYNIWPQQRFVKNKNIQGQRFK